MALSGAELHCLTKSKPKHQLMPNLWIKQHSKRSLTKSHRVSTLIALAFWKLWSQLVFIVITVTKEFTVPVSAIFLCQLVSMRPLKVFANQHQKMVQSVTDYEAYLGFFMLFGAKLDISCYCISGCLAQFSATHGIKPCDHSLNCAAMLLTSPCAIEHRPKPLFSVNTASSAAVTGDD